MALSHKPKKDKPRPVQTCEFKGCHSYLISRSKGHKWLCPEHERAGRKQIVHGKMDTRL